MDKMINKISKFYNSLADDYDELTRFSERFDKEKSAFQKIIKDYRLNSVLDAGCGTGFHSILLTQLGAKVVSTELAFEMIKKAKINAKEEGINLNIIQSSFQKIHKNVTGKFDAIFCLGNSLSHLHTNRELIASLKSFKQVLRSNGLIVLQMLNYDKILKNKSKIQNIRITDKKIYIRFYDYLNSKIDFNVLVIKKNEKPIDYTINSIGLRAWKKNEIIKALKHSGFKNVDCYGDIFRNKFDKSISRDIVLFANK